MVGRAGATTIAELTVSGLPAVLVPYPYATGRHQEANARALQRAGGASILLDDQVTADSLAARMEDLIGFDERLRAMAEASARFGRPDAAERLADLVLDVVRRRPRPRPRSRPTSPDRGRSRRSPSRISRGYGGPIWWGSAAPA